MRDFLKKSDQWVDMACRGLQISNEVAPSTRELPVEPNVMELPTLPQQEEALSAKGQLQAHHLGNLAGAVAGAGTFALLADMMLEIPIEKLVELTPHAATFFLSCMEVMTSMHMSSAMAALPGVVGAGVEGAELLDAVSNTVEGLDVLEGIATLGLSLLAGAAVKAGVESMYEEDRQRNLLLRQALQEKMEVLQEVAKAKPNTVRMEASARSLEQQNMSPWVF
ncbi:MAG: hypothetical protein EP343_34750 [Deltaproteobacteria bacterium]|nr:MAG: hypothetical protein EP343_34750 [Deltaproteobacteria bacterium]